MKLQICIDIASLKGNNDIKVLALLAENSPLPAAALHQYGIIRGSANARMAVQSCLRKRWIRREGSRNRTGGRPATLYGLTAAGKQHLRKLGFCSLPRTYEEPDPKRILGAPVS